MLQPLFFKLEAAVKTGNGEAIREMLKKTAPEFGAQGGFAIHAVLWLRMEKKCTLNK